MTEQVDLETYLFILQNKFFISLYDPNKLKNYYTNEFYLGNKINSIDIDHLNQFLNENIFKIEKLTGKFVKNIFVVIENTELFNFNIGLKKKKLR